MYEYWNDPPDDDYEIPSTCPHCGSHDTVIVTLNNQFACENCNSIIECESRDEGYSEEEIERSQARIGSITGDRCPHGNEWGECDACDFAGDIAYDTERERRMR